MKSVAIFCGGGWFEWSPDSVVTGIPGSEEAVIYASEALVKRGFVVTIYNSPLANSKWSEPTSNPRYRPFNDIGQETEIDILIIWRCQTLPDWLLDRSDHVFYWLHDTGCGSNFSVSDQISGVFYLTNFHKTTFPCINDDVPSIICGNGIKLEQFSNAGKVPRDPYKCIYSSNYARGLTILLRVWPEIKEAVPKATLDVYYGREVYGAISEEGLQNIINQFGKLGVTEHGMIGHQELADAMCSAGLLTYPCNCPNAETYCITVVKAQAAGLIPVCTNLGGLSETLNPESSIIIEGGFDTEENITVFRDKVIDALRNHEKYEHMRELGMRFAAEKTWDNVIDKWLQLYDEVDMLNNFV